MFGEFKKVKLWGGGGGGERKRVMVDKFIGSVLKQTGDGRGQAPGICHRSIFPHFQFDH